MPFSIKEDEEKNWKSRLKEYLKEHAFLVFITCAALIGALFLVVMGLRAGNPELRANGLLSIGGECVGSWSRNPTGRKLDR